MSVQVPRGKPPAISSSSPLIPLGVRSIVASLMCPFLDRIEVHAAKLVKLLFAENHVRATVTSQFKMLCQKDGFFWTDILAKSTVNAPQHINIERERIFLDLTALELSSNDGDCLGWADLLAKKAGHTLFSAVLI